MLNINSVLVKWGLIVLATGVLSVSAYFKGYNSGAESVRRDIAKKQEAMLEDAQNRSESYEKEKVKNQEKLNQSIRTIYVSKNPDFNNCHDGADWLREYKNMD